MCVDPTPRPRPSSHAATCHSSAPPLPSHVPTALGAPRPASPDRGAPSLRRYVKRGTCASYFCTYTTTPSSGIEIDCAHSDVHSGVLPGIRSGIRPGIPLDRHPHVRTKTLVGGRTGGSDGLPDWLVRKPVDTSGRRAAMSAVGPAPVDRPPPDYQPLLPFFPNSVSHVSCAPIDNLFEKKKRRARERALRLAGRSPSVSSPRPARTPRMVVERAPLTPFIGFWCRGTHFRSPFRRPPEKSLENGSANLLHTARGRAIIDVSPGK
ncbi:hypothetical protein LV75_001722 [Actinokineospora diospyrosa]|uniref:Uncharacterized protein n=1 Tax=Actinokineospora diospyrosa TaxID=103728 RepID=A0ABT1I9C2_9PSEU|nr:hypothetical protein [Actinokineospora diospyrosa]